MPSDKTITTGVRLPTRNRLALDELAERFHNTPAGMIRLAVDQLIASIDANDGQLPEPLVTRLKEETTHPYIASKRGGDQ